MKRLGVRRKLQFGEVHWHCSGAPGVYSLEDEGGVLLFVAWTEDLVATLTEALSENHPRNAVLRLRAAYFRAREGAEPEVAAAVFDAYMDEHGYYPAGMQAPPEGSRTVAVPGKREVDATDPVGTPSMIPSRPMTVVLLNRDLSILATSKELFERLGYRVSAATGLETFARACQVDPLDLLLIDHDTVGASVNTVVQAVRRLRPSTMILVVARKESHPELMPLLQHGVAAIVPIPYGVRVIHQFVLEHRRARPSTATA